MLTRRFLLDTPAQGCWHSPRGTGATTDGAAAQEAPSATAAVLRAATLQLLLLLAPLLGPMSAASAAVVCSSAGGVLRARSPADQGLSRFFEGADVGCLEINSCTVAAAEELSSATASRQRSPCSPPAKSFNKLATLDRYFGERV